MTAPARLDRASFDALVQRRCAALAEAAPGSSSDLADAERRREAEQEAELLDASAREFADAVDRRGDEMPYEDAVVITGTSGVVTVSAEEYRREPVYWEARAGEVHSLTLGPLLVAALREQS